MSVKFDDLPKPQSNIEHWTWREETSITTYPFNKNECPKVSIVTPSFNQSEFIEQTIRSVLLQNYPNLQYIVIDGGSTDNTVQVLEKYSTWIDYWVSEPDSGQSHAINKGLEICDGEWFNWINSDDYLMPGAITKMITQTNLNDKSLSIIAGSTENIQDDTSLGSYSVTLRADLDFPFFSLGINQPGSLLRLIDVRECNGVREDLELCMDLDLWLRILLKNDRKCLKVIPDVLAAYRYHDKSKTCSAQDVFALEEFTIITDVYKCLSNRTHLHSISFLRGQYNSKEDNYKSSKLYETALVKKAYYNRLLVDDSLLFRAIMRSTDLHNKSFYWFKKILEELNLEIHQLYGRNTKHIIAKAWLRAMQNNGKLNRVGALCALRDLPLLSTAIELVRIAIKG
jgi:glycosyltransferase involved in cell wall biosynthesis